MTDQQKELYRRWKRLVNMSSPSLESFMASEEGKRAGLSRSEAASQGIKSGRDSARAILRMRLKSPEDWTPEDWRWCKRQISFISRMRGTMVTMLAKGKDPLWYTKDGKRVKTRLHLSLLIWGHKP